MHLERNLHGPRAGFEREMGFLHGVVAGNCVAQILLARHWVQPRQTKRAPPLGGTRRVSVHVADPYTGPSATNAQYALLSVTASN